MPRKQAVMQIKVVGPLDEPVSHYIGAYTLGQRENEGGKWTIGNSEV